MSRGDDPDFWQEMFWPLVIAAAFMLVAVCFGVALVAIGGFI